MRCFMMLLGRNTSTRRGVIGTSWPVLGLRPTRSPFWRMPKEPKEESFTDSPGRQARRDLVQDELDELLGLVTGQSDLLDHRFRKIRTRERFATHGIPPLPSTLPPPMLTAAFSGVNNNQLKLHT